MRRLMTKPTKLVRPAKNQISLGIRPVWSESSLSAWRKLGSLATHQAHSEDSDQPGWAPPRLIWVFAGRTVTLLVLSCRGSNVKSLRPVWAWNQKPCGSMALQGRYWAQSMAFKPCYAPAIVGPIGLKWLVHCTGSKTFSDRATIYLARLKTLGQ